MSHIPRLTFIGAYAYDNSLFQNLNLPDGIEKELAVNTFLLKYGECPMLYTDLKFQKLAFTIWSNKWYDGLSHILEALEAEYNPIHNFDRYEEYSDTESQGQTTDYTGSETTNYTGSETYEESTSENGSESSSATTENTVSAFNASTYQPDTKNQSDSERENGLERDTGSERRRNLADAHARNLKDTMTGNRRLNHLGHLYGNIGLTTSQQMILAEIDMRETYNIYDIISDMLRQEFCLYYY